MQANRASQLFLLFVLLSGLLTAALSPQSVFAKRVPMGHPSLFVSLYDGSDPQFDFIIIENANTIETLKADIDAKLYNIFDTIFIPQVRKEFDEGRNIYSDSYVEGIRAYIDMNELTLDILIEKVPPEYGCNEESCAHRKVSVDIPAERKLSYTNQIGFSIAVYEEMGGGNEYDQFVERILMKAIAEARFLFSEGANVLEANKEILLEDNTIIEHILLRQYEDISRISVLFSPSDVGVSSSSKKPLDVVISSNSYYERYYSQQESEDGQEPTEEILQECERLGIEEAECSIVAIAHNRIDQVADDRDISDEGNSVTTDSLTLIGIGAAAATVVAVAAIRKLK